MARPAPSPALLAQLSCRFGDSPGHAAWLARQAAPAPEPPPRGGHTELALVRLTHEDARIRRGGGLPAVWSAYG